jgi:hypothetical protein
MNRKLVIGPLLFAALVLGGGVASTQQMADPEFNAVVEHPAYTKGYPRVLFDEAHNNFHTSGGRYKPFADLITSDGYRVVANRKPFTKETLGSFKVLVIANALGAEEMDDEGADQPAFTEDECDVVRDWIRSGGALLLIADHAPFGAAAQNLAKRFEVEMSKGFVFDGEHGEQGNPSVLVFSRENKLLLDTPITNGRNDSEKTNRVLAFTGQAIKGPETSLVFLRLGEQARDKANPSAESATAVGGQAQGLALKFGKGRVVVLGEAAMLSAQTLGSQAAGSHKMRMGMNVPGIDNRQLALNIMHWLSGLLK